MSVIARTAFTGRKRARVVGDADPYGLAVGLAAACRRPEDWPPYNMPFIK